MKLLRNSLITAALLAAAPAFAQAVAYPNWYLGAGIGRGNLGVSGSDLTGLNNASVDDSSNTYTVRLGWRFNPWMAIEGGYYDLGKYQFSGSGASPIRGEAKAKSYGLSFVGILPMDQFDLYGRIGYARSELKLNANISILSTPYNAKDTQSEATYGVGGRWNMSRNWSFFAEWAKNDKIQVDSYMAGIDYRF